MEKLTGTKYTIFQKKRFDIAKEIQLKPNDVLMTKDGTIGKILIIKEIPYPHKASLNSHLLVFRPKGNSYVPIFLYYQLSSSLFKNQIELSKSGPLSLESPKNPSANLILFFQNAKSKNQ